MCSQARTFKILTFQQGLTLCRCKNMLYSLVANANFCRQVPLAMATNESLKGYGHLISGNLLKHVTLLT